jgi:hypothetical protein
MNKEYVMNTIGEALLTGRAGLSYFVNAVPGMEYNLGKYHETGNIEYLDDFLKMSKRYLRAVESVRDSYHQLDDLFRFIQKEKESDISTHDNYIE